MKKKLTKLISMLLIIVLLFSINLPAVSAASTPFVDVPADSWFYDAVVWALMYGITEGTTATTFSPHSHVTRAEFVTFIYRLEGEPPVWGRSNFSDVANPNSFFFDAVLWATGAGIVNGWGDGTFRPHTHISREEMAAFIHRYARFRGDDMMASGTVIASFADRGSISAPFVEAMQWATYHGFIRGYNNRINPRDTSTRAQAMTVLYRAVTDASFDPPPAQGFTHGSMFNGVLIGGPAAPTANDQQIWNFFRSRGLSSFATAGIMGNLFAESGMRPNAVERVHWWRLESPVTNLRPMSDEAYTTAVNNGVYRHEHPNTGLHWHHRLPNVRPMDNARASFALDRVGFGLSQWTYPTRKAWMYDFISEFHEELGVPFNIGCLDAQLEFIWLELTEGYPGVLNDLRLATCVYEASDIILRRFMRPANIQSARGVRAGFSLSYFTRFAQ